MLYQGCGCRFATIVSVAKEKKKKKKPSRLLSFQGSRARAILSGFLLILLSMRIKQIVLMLLKGQFVCKYVISFLKMCILPLMNLGTTTYICQS